MRFRSLALAALLATSAIPAHAGYTTITYDAYVSTLSPPDDGGQAAPDDIFVGQNVVISATVDLSQLVSFGTYRTSNGRTGAPMVLHPAGVSFYNDPHATYTVTIGSHVWTQADESSDDSGYVAPSGVGPFPLLAYDGDPSQLIGLNSDAVNAEGLEFYSAPADTILQARGHLHPIYGGSTQDDGFGFTVDYYTVMQEPTDAVTNDTLLAIRAEALAEGQIPEPSSWALLMLGALGLWKASKRKAVSGRAPTLMPA